MSWLFGKKKFNSVSDKVWIAEKYKISGFLNDLKMSQPDEIKIIIYYFKNFQQECIDLFQQNNITFEEIERNSFSELISLNYLINAEIIESSTALERIIAKFESKNLKFLFTEHYPIFSREKNILDKINSSLTKNTETIFYSSLDEPAFKMFGGDRIIEIVRKMGLAEDDCIQHAMISSAIASAQEKIEKKIAFESKANSAKEWFSRNNVSDY